MNIYELFCYFVAISALLLGVVGITVLGILLTYVNVWLKIVEINLTILDNKNMDSLNDQVYKNYLLKYAISRVISERNKWERHLNPDIAEFFFHSVKELNKLDTTLQNPFS